MTSENLKLVNATEVPADKVMQFRQEFLSAGERSINGSRGLHHYETYEDWLRLAKECEKSDNTLLGVPASTYLAVRISDEKVVGCIELRHTLNESLAVIGGHIGYSVAPSERRKGYATEMLKLVLDEAKRAGLDKVLLTCDTDNVASCKTIEKCGGKPERKEPFVFENETYFKYWIEVEMKYQLAIFDLDGTLLNTLEDLADSVNYVMRCFGYPERTLAEVRNFVGNGIRKLLERSAPENTTAEEIDRLFEQFTAYYKEHCADKTRPYEGIPELLQTLREKGVKIAVVSNKADFAVKALCEQYFPGLLDEAVGERAGIARKPAPDTVNEVLKNLQIDKSQAVYIGDSEVDVLTAQNAELDCIAVNWGFRDTQILKEAGAEIIVSTPETIADYF